MWPVFVVLGFGALVAACTNREEKKADVASAKSQCDEFGRAAPQRNVDQDSFDTFKLMWPNDLAASNMQMWQPRARLYFGAAEELLRPTCEKHDAYSKDQVANLMNSSAIFLGAHYSEPVNTLEGSILFLLAGLAPASMTKDDVFGAYDALAREKPSEKDFAELLKAAWWFNKAAENADYRFVAPSASSVMTVQDRKNATDALVEMDRILNGVNIDNLNDRQKEYYFVLQFASGILRSSLQSAAPNSGGSGRSSTTAGTSTATPVPTVTSTTPRPSKDGENPPPGRIPGSYSPPPKKVDCNKTPNDPECPWGDPDPARVH